MGNAKKTAKSVGIIMFFTLTGKFLGSLRDILIARKFGSGDMTDTYFIALDATMVFMGLVGAALNTTLIPILSEIEAKYSKEKKINYLNNVFHVVFFLSIIFSLIGWIFSPQIIGIFAKGFEGEKLQLAVKLHRIGLPITFFSVATYIFTGYLENNENFGIPAATSFPFNFVYIVFLVFLSQKYGIEGLMVASVLAALSQVLIQIPSARKLGYRYEYVFDMKDKYLRKALILTIPVLIGSAVDKINAIIDKTLASDLVKGSISALTYADRIKGAVLGVFVLAIAKVIFPILSKESNKNNKGYLVKVLTYGINVILIITVPATIGFIVLSEPLIRIFLERGAFDSIATLMTSQALVFYSFGIVGVAIKIMLSRVYYSLQDTKTPMINGIIAVIINIIMNLILVGPLKHKGLALATSISDILTSLIFIYSLKKRINAIKIKDFAICLIKTTVASIIMGIVVYFTYGGLSSYIEKRITPATSTFTFIKDIIVLIIPVAIGGIVYFGFCYLFKVKEINLIVDNAKERLNRD